MKNIDENSHKMNTDNEAAFLDEKNTDIEKDELLQNLEESKDIISDQNEKESKRRDLGLKIAIILLAISLTFAVTKIVEYKKASNPTIVSKDGNGTVSDIKRFNGVDTVVIGTDSSDALYGLAVPAYVTPDANNMLNIFIKNSGNTDVLCAVQFRNSKTQELQLIYEMDETLAPGGKEHFKIDLNKAKIANVDSILVSDKASVAKTGLMYSIKIKK